MRMRHLVALIVLVSATLLSSHPALAQFTQQGPKLLGTGAVRIAYQGYSVSLSADGNTAIVGGYGDNSNAGAAWVFAINAEPAGLVEDAHATGATISNVNKVLESGETVLVNPSWKNITASPLTLTGTASAFTGPAGAIYSLLDSSAGYGTIPPGGNSLFGDVLPTDGGCRFIHYIYAGGVIAGCGGGNYCPASNVNRWQMAVFLVTAFKIPLLY